MRIILSWIYANTGSLLPAQLTHANSTGILVLFSPPGITPHYLLIWYKALAVLLWIVAGMLIKKYGKQLKV